ncbi:hypothetical protein [Nonomuraea guangzhouensis]|uniref:Uncharacterized protein n=1 Tax=Nonomuraea guangzhouensis TaxID=1291555 RepID=A0ABW4GTX0_9ACTN|nr:hypothetical protein [Nonomuraea guangzhouensis]
MSVDFEQTIDRALTRGMAMAGSADAAEIERSWRHRYIPSQQLYFATARPTDHADIIVYNDQLHEPTWDIRSARPERSGIGMNSSSGGQAEIEAGVHVEAEPAVGVDVDPE